MFIFFQRILHHVVFNHSLVHEKTQQSNQNEVCYSNCDGICRVLQQCSVPWIVGEV